MPPGGNRKEPPIGKVSTPFGVARELPYAEFMEELLPLLDPRIDFNTLTLNTHKRRSNLPMTKNSHLWGYSTKKPSQIPGGRRNAYKNFQISAGKIHKAIPGIEPTLVFKNNDNAEWTLEKRDMDALPDAYLFLRSSSEEDVNWTSIAVPGAYSIWDTPDTFRENVVKITRCMSQCMYRDARRRFVYAFTIQDERMRLWWCDRVKILFTESFDCIAHSVLLFEFFISVMYAPPERLGFDPTMKLLNHPRDNVHLAQYEISVRSEDGQEQQYKTLALLADAEETILGRNTRVWKAIKIENGVPVGEPVVLKDAWVHPYREREGAIYSRVWATASEAQRNALDAACISVLCHGDVFVCESPDCAMYYKDALRCRNRGAARAIEAHASQCEAHHLIHNRVVFKQIGRSMLGETSLAKIFGGLRDAANALQVLHECGWIHGDISTGNILLVNNRAVLTDLEYAQHKDERRNHDETGTLCFMSLEVAAHSYLFRQANPVEEPRRTRGKKSAHNNSKLPFIYNPLHDLESLWWVALFFIVAGRVMDDKSGSFTENARREDQAKFAKKLFRTYTYRTRAFQDSDCFEEVLDSLHPALEEVGLALDMLRNFLLAAYVDAEKDVQNIQFDVAVGVHACFIEFFGSLAQSLHEKDITIDPLACEN